MAAKCDVKFVLFLECPKDICIERALERGKTSGRSDDNIETLKKRFDTYEGETRPIVTLFASKGMLRTVLSTRAVDEVFADVAKLFNAL